MNHRRSLILAASIVGFVAAADPSAAAADAIPDKKLEAVLRENVFEKRGTDKELTDDDLKKIFVLDAKNKGVKELTGIEKCVNLQQINMAKNEIADVTPLKGLTNLQSLDLAGNKIRDIAPLESLTGLQFLELSNNEIANIEPLAKLVKLSALYIAGNKISDLKPLANLTRLSSLDLARNEIAHLTPLAKLGGLMLLKLSDNKIEDISPLPKKNQLTMLFLERNKIADLSPLIAAAKDDSEGDKRFAPFLRLYLAGNPLSDAAKTQQIDALKKYGVRLLVTEPKKN